MGQAEAKLADSEMCCGGKRSRERNNRLGHNPRNSQNESSFFNFGMNDEEQENYPTRNSVQTHPFIEPTPREQGPRRGVVGMKAPKFTIVAESESAHPEPNQTLLNEIVNHPKTTPLGVRAHQPNSLPVQKPNWTPQYPNGAQTRHSTSYDFSRSLNSSSVSIDGERLSMSYEGTADSVNISRSSTSSGEGVVATPYSVSTGMSWNGSSSSSARNVEHDHRLASDKARTVSNSPFAAAAPANPLATRGELPQGALPRSKSPKPMSNGRAERPLPQPAEEGDATTERFIAEVKSLIDKSREQLKKAEFRRSRKRMGTADSAPEISSHQRTPAIGSYVALQ